MLVCQPVVLPFWEPLISLKKYLMKTIRFEDMNLPFESISTHCAHSFILSRQNVSHLTFWQSWQLTVNHYMWNYFYIPLAKLGIVFYNFSKLFIILFIYFLFIKDVLGPFFYCWWFFHLEKLWFIWSTFISN